MALRMILTFAFVAGVIIFMNLAGCTPVQAQDGWPVFRQHHRFDYYRRPKRYYAQRDDAACAGEHTLATSVLSDTEAGAMFSAKIAWGAKVRAEIGEHYMDVELAADARHRCYRAGTNETLLGKAVAATTGDFQWRCEIKARACKPGWQPMERR